MRIKVFLDLDGIIADFTAGYCELHKVENPFAADRTFRGDEAWDVIKQTGLTPEEFWAPMGRDFWAGLPKTEEADEIIEELDVRVGLENVCFLSTPCMTEGCEAGKRDWIRQHYPGIPALFSVTAKGAPVGPKEFCAAPNAILIDDHTPNIQKWTEAGGIGFLFPRPWNQLHAWEPLAMVELFEFLNAVWRVDVHRCGPVPSPAVPQTA